MSTPFSPSRPLPPAAAAATELPTAAAVDGRPRALDATATPTPPATPMDAWVPHRGRMSLLDAIERLDDQRILARVTVPAAGLFATPAGMPAWIGIEYMAQAVAAWSGARARAAGGVPRIGFLLGSRRYEAQVALFEIGAELEVSAECELIGDNGLGLFDCRISQAGRLLATGRLSVYEPGPEAPAGAADERPRPGHAPDTPAASREHRQETG